MSLWPSKPTAAIHGETDVRILPGWIATATITATVLAAGWYAGGYRARQLRDPNEAGDYGDPAGWNLDIPIHRADVRIVFPSDDSEAIEFRQNGPKTFEGPVLLSHPTCPLVQGTNYRVRFRGRSDTEKPLRLTVHRAKSPAETLGLDWSIRLNTEWENYEREFTATSDESTPLLTITFEEEGQPFWFRLSGTTVDRKTSH